MLNDKNTTLFFIYLQIHLTLQKIDYNYLLNKQIQLNTECFKMIYKLSTLYNYLFSLKVIITAIN